MVINTFFCGNTGGISSQGVEVMNVRLHAIRKPRSIDIKTDMDAISSILCETG